VGRSHDKLYCLALMQHYGAPTRLLDCTYSPFIAAHNAVKDGLQIDKCEIPLPHVVWCFRSSWLDEQAKRVAGEEKVNARNDDQRRNDNTFNELYQPSWRFVLHDNPLRLNERLSIQQGIFLCPASIEISFRCNLSGMEDFNHENNVRILKLKLNREERIKFIEQLRRMNISSAALLPGLEGFCRSLGEHLVHFSNLAGSGAGG
jgi:FRG domain